MSTDGQLNPDRIRGGTEAATDRGDHLCINCGEELDLSTLRGIEQYRRESFPGKIDAESRRSISRSTLILVGLVVVIGIPALVLLSVLGAPTEPTENFLTSLEIPVFSTVSMIAGFFFGRAGQESTGRSR